MSVISDCNPVMFVSQVVSLNYQFMHSEIQPCPRSGSYWLQSDWNILENCWGKVRTDGYIQYVDLLAIISSRHGEDRWPCVTIFVHSIYILIN